MAKRKSAFARNVIILLSIVAIATLTYVNADSWFGSSPVPVTKKKQSKKSTVTNNSKKNQGIAVKTPDPAPQEKPLPKDDPAPVVVQKNNEKHENAFQEYNTLLKERKYEEARAALKRAWDGTYPDDVRIKMKEDMMMLTKKHLFSSTSEDMTIYTVQQGDMLSTIARKLSTKERRIDYRQIMYFNHLSTSMIREGKRLRVPLGAFTIIAQKATFTLSLYYEGCLLKEFSIAIGKDDKTPNGTFEIKNKVPDPIWYKTNPLTGVTEKIPPPNVLGKMWMGFIEPNESYGIHGTDNPDVIGTTATEGCIRMHNESVLELSKMIALGTTVNIID